jgi:glycosyltransferase involved in cell wall biosynthesis
MFKPVKVIDIELSQPLTDLQNLDGYAFLQALIRVHGSPAGYVKIPITNGSCSKTALVNSILENHNAAIVRRLLYEGLSRNVLAESFSINDMLRTAKPAKQDRKLPLVTVAVCTRDNTAYLSSCLASLDRLDYPNLDILIIDNAPTSDATQRLVTAGYQNMRYFCEPRPGLNWARNRAIIEARGEIIAYTDDDVVVDRAWITALAKVFSEDPEVMAVTGLVVPFELETEAQELFEKYGGFGRGFERKWVRMDAASNIKLATLHGGTGKFGTGANMAYRRTLFNEIGYFDPALDVGTVTNGGGDLDMFFRVLKEGHMLVYEPGAIVRHCHRRNYAHLHAQLTNWGIGFISHLTRNALAYPDERAAFVRLGLWWIWKKIRSVLVSFLRPGRLRDLYMAELRGTCIGIFRYFKARSAAEKIKGAFPPLPALPVTAAPRQSSPGKRFIPKKPTAIRSIDLSQPLCTVDDLHDYNKIQMLVTCKGRPAGALNLSTFGCSLSPTRLCESLVDQLGLRLLDPDHSRSMDLLLAESYAALRQYFQPKNDKGEEAPAICPTGSASLPSASIIIATYDRPDDLRYCLTHIKAQTSARSIEIIVVDNNPDSGLTPPVVGGFPDTLLIREHRKGLSYARNAGIIASSGDIIVTVDDDVAMPPHWLEELLSPFVRTDVMIVTGNVLPMELETSAQHLFEVYGGLGRGFVPLEFDRKWFESSVRRAVPTWKLGATANAAFRATIFSHPQIGLMDEALGAGTPTGCSEDTYVFYKVLKAGYTILYKPSAYLWHRHRRDIPALRRQIYNYSKGHVAYHLTTLIRQHDLRALIRLFIELPQAHLWRMKSQFFGKSAYPFSLTLREIAGNLAGPFALWRSRRRVKRLGRSQPFIPFSVRPDNDQSVAETRGVQPVSIPGPRN